MQYYHNNFFICDSRENPNATLLRRASEEMRDYQRRDLGAHQAENLVHATAAYTTVYTTVQLYYI